MVQWLQWSRVRLDTGAIQITREHQLKLDTYRLQTKEVKELGRTSTDLNQWIQKTESMLQQLKTETAP